MTSNEPPPLPLSLPMPLSLLLLVLFVVDHWTNLNNNCIDLKQHSSNSLWSLGVGALRLLYYIWKPTNYDGGATNTQWSDLCQPTTETMRKCQEEFHFAMAAATERHRKYGCFLQYWINPIDPTQIKNKTTTSDYTSKFIIIIINIIISGGCIYMPHILHRTKNSTPNRDL